MTKINVSVNLEGSEHQEFFELFEIRDKVGLLLSRSVRLNDEAQIIVEELRSLFNSSNYYQLRSKPIGLYKLTSNVFNAPHLIAGVNKDDPSGKDFEQLLSAIFSELGSTLGGLIVDNSKFPDQ